jgi:hypothetical protein
MMLSSSASSSCRSLARMVEKCRHFRIHQELLAVGGHGGAEVVADAFMPVHFHGQAKSGGKVDAQLPFGCVAAGLQLSDGHS